MCSSDLRNRLPDSGQESAKVRGIPHSLDFQGKLKQLADKPDFISELPHNAIVNMSSPKPRIPVVSEHLILIIHFVKAKIRHQLK